MWSTCLMWRPVELHIRYTNFWYTQRFHLQGTRRSFKLTSSQTFSNQSQCVKSQKNIDFLPNVLALIHIWTWTWCEGGVRSSTIQEVCILGHEMQEQGFKTLSFGQSMKCFRSARSRYICMACNATYATTIMFSRGNNYRLRWSRGSVLASSTQVRGFKPARSRRIFRAKKSSARLHSEGK